MFSLIASLLVFFAGAYAQIELPHGHELKEIINQQFTILDKNGDGVINVDELSYFIDEEDVNNDGAITLAEYMAYTQLPQEVAEPIFNAYDDDDDGVILNNFMVKFFNMLDHNGDGTISENEYVQYQTSFLECVFGHGNHGHGADCSE